MSLQFNVGDIVWVDTDDRDRLSERYTGPAKITQADDERNPGDDEAYYVEGRGYPRFYNWVTEAEVHPARLADGTPVAVSAMRGRASWSGRVLHYNPSAGYYLIRHGSNGRHFRVVPERVMYAGPEGVEVPWVRADRPEPTPGAAVRSDKQPDAGDVGAWKAEIYRSGVERAATHGEKYVEMFKREAAALGIVPGRPVWRVSFEVPYDHQPSPAEATRALYCEVPASDNALTYRVEQVRTEHIVAEGETIESLSRAIWQRARELRELYNTSLNGGTCSEVFDFLRELGIEEPKKKVQVVLEFEVAAGEDVDWMSARVGERVQPITLAGYEGRAVEVREVEA